MIRGVYGAVIAVAVALLGLNMAFAEGTRVRHAVKTVWMNEDNQHFYDGRYHGDEDMTVEDCRALVDKYADTGVCTGILFCVNMQRALYDSDVWERFKDQQTDYSYQRHLRLLSDRGLVRDSAEARFTGLKRRENMKKNGGWLVLMLVLSFSEGWAGEKPYDFRKRLEVIHQADRRDPAAKCAAGEYEIADGFRIGIAADAGDFVYRVARDFEDYLAVSMKVCASVVRGAGDLTLALDGVDGYSVEIGGTGVKVTAATTRENEGELNHRVSPGVG